MFIRYSPTAILRQPGRARSVGPCVGVALPTESCDATALLWPHSPEWPGLATTGPRESESCRNSLTPAVQTLLTAESPAEASAAPISSSAACASHCLSIIWSRSGPQWTAVAFSPRRVRVPCGGPTGPGAALERTHA